jgi:hypothetical protein
MVFPQFTGKWRQGRAFTVLNDPAEHERSPEDRLTDIEVADQYNLKRKTLQKWRHLKKGPPFERAESKVLYRRADIEAWLAKYQVVAR